VPIQTEEFIQEILEQEPSKTQLHFCLGLINFYAKEDYGAAERDLARFLEYHRETVDQTVRQEAERLLAAARKAVRG